MLNVQSSHDVNSAKQSMAVCDTTHLPTGQPVPSFRRANSGFVTLKAADGLDEQALGEEGSDKEDGELSDDSSLSRLKLMMKRTLMKRTPVYPPPGHQQGVRTGYPLWPPPVGSFISQSPVAQMQSLEGQYDQLSQPTYPGYDSFDRTILPISHSDNIPYSPTSRTEPGRLYPWLPTAQF